jgi:hypothetical protein
MFSFSCTIEWEHYRQVVGKSQALTFNVTDMATLHADLKSKGVRITQEPDPQPWGTYMMIFDENNNGLLMVEPPNSSLLQGKQTVDALFRIYIKMRKK